MRDWVLRRMPEMQGVPLRRRQTLMRAARARMVRRPRYWLAVVLPLLVYALPMVLLWSFVTSGAYRRWHIEPDLLLKICVLAMGLFSLGMLPMTGAIVWMEIQRQRAEIRELLRDRHGRWRVCACGYNLRHATGDHCPECGRVVVQARG